MSRLLTFWRDRRGNSAIEFGLLLPLFLMMILGTIGVSQLMFAVNSLHYAVEEAARCGAINTTVCGSLTETEDYARVRYTGPNVEPEFTATDTGCGRRVRATAAFKLEAGVLTWDVPLAAESCFAAPEPT